MPNVINAGTIQYGVDFNVNETSLNNITSNIQRIKQMTLKEFKSLNPNIEAELNDEEILQKLSTIKIQSQQLESALVSAFNPKIDSINIENFNKQLESTKLRLNDVVKGWSTMGTEGAQATVNLAAQLQNVNNVTQKTNTLADKMVTTLGNTLRWSISSSALQTFTNSIANCYNYVKDLDKSLTSIQVVTQKSSEEMEEFATTANNAAKALGTSTTTYTKAAQTFYQQGLGDEEANARATLSTKVSNVTGLSGDDSAEYVTSVLNGYKVGSEEAEAAMDKLANVGAHTASSLAELSEGMSKTASAANLMGVSEDQLAATLATVISTTRQNASSVGTAFKTIYARISDIEAGTEDADTSLGNYTSDMAALGYNVLDSSGQLRDLGDVIEEIGGNWSNMSREQQVSLARTMAGTRQYNNLLSLFDNWSEYQEALNYSLEATGTLEEQNNIYLDSTAGHLNTLTANAQDLYDSLLTSNDIETVADAFSKLLEFTTSWVDVLGGGLGVLRLVVPLIMKMASSKIASGVANLTSSKGSSRFAAQEAKKAELTRDFQNSVENQNNEKTTQAVNNVVGVKGQYSKYYDKGLVSEEDDKILTDLTNQRADIEKDILKNEENLSKVKKEIAGYDKEILEIEEKQNTIKESQKQGGAVDSLQTDSKAINKQKITKKNVSKLQGSMASQGSNLLDVYKNNGIEPSKELEENVKILQNENSSVNEIKKAWAAVYKEIRNVNTALNEQNNKLNEDKSEVEGNKTTAGDRQTDYEAEQKKLEAQQGQNDNASKSLEGKFKNAEKAQKLLNTISSGMMVISALKTSMNIFDVLDDNSLSAGEKAEQVISGIVTVVMTLSMALPTLAESFTGTALAAKLGIETVESASGILLAITLAITVVVGIVKGLISIFDNAIASMEELEDAVDLTAEAYNNVKSSYDDFVSGMSDYQDQIDNLKTLQEGTEEYASALQSANKEALSLIETGQLTTQDYEIDASGAIKIDDDALAEAQEKQQEKVQKAQLGSLTSQWYVQQKKYEEALEDSQSKLNAGGTYAQEKSITATTSLEATEAIGNSTEAPSTITVVTDEKPTSGGLLDSKDVEKLASAYNKTGGLKEAIKYLRENKEENDISDETEEALKEIEKNPDNWSDVVSNVAKIQQQLEVTKGEVASQVMTTTQGKDFTGLGGNLQNWVIDKSGLKDLDSEDVYDKKQELIGDSEAKDQAFRDYADAFGWTIEEGLTGITSVTDDQGNAVEMDDETILQEIAAYQVQLEQGNSKETTEAIDQANTLQTMFSGNSALAGKFAEGMENGFSSEAYSSEEMGQIASVLSGYSSSLEEMFGTENVDTFMNQVMSIMKGDNRSDDYEKQDEESRKEARSSIVSSGVSDNGTSLVSKLNDGSLNYQNIESDSDYQELYGQLDNLTTFDSSLKDDAEILKNTFLAGSDEFLQAAENLTNAAEEANTVDTMDSSIKKANRAEKSFKEVSTDAADLDEAKSRGDTEAVQEYQAKLNLDFSEAEEDLEAFTSTQYEVEASLKVDVETDLSSFEDFTNAKEEALDYIEDGNKVAAKDLTELESAIPGITKGMKDLGDGTYQLSAESKKAAFDSLNSEVEAEKQKYIKKVELKKAYEKQQLKYYQNIADTYQQYLDGEIDEEEASTDIKKQLNKLETADKDYQDQVQKDNNAESLNEQSEDEKTAATNFAQTWLDAINLVHDNKAKMLDDTATIDKEAKGIGQVLGLATDTASTDEAVSNANATGNVSTDVNKTTAKKGLKSANAMIKSLEKEIGLDDATIAEYNGVTSGLTSAEASSGSGSSSGSSSDSSSSKDTMDLITKEDIDVYHDADQQLDAISNDLEILQTQQKRLYGKELTKNLQKQLDLLEKQQDTQEEKLSIAQNEAKSQRKTLSNYGITFDEDGQIKNYEKTLEKYRKAANKAIKKYNKTNSDADKERAEKAQDKYEKLLDLIDDYDETINSTIPEIEQGIQDTLSDMAETEYAQLDVEVNLSVNRDDFLQQWTALQKNLNFDTDNDILGTLFENYSNLLATEATDKVGAAVDRLTTLMQDATLKGLDKEQYQEKLTEYLKDVNEAYSEAKEYYDNIQKAWSDSVSAVKEAQEAQLKVYENINSQLEHQIKLNELLYGDSAKAKSASYYNAQAKNSEAQLVKAREQLSEWDSIREDAITKFNAGEITQDELDSVLENYQSCLDQMYSYAEETIENIVSSWAAQMEASFNSVMENLSGGVSVSYLQEQKELIKKSSDIYLDEVNSSYAIEKIKNKWTEAINSTDSLEGQQKLREVMDSQVSELEEKGQLSQYEVDRAEKLLDLEIKRQALEDAQNAKSTMRLRRDANGNYTYQYVADEDSTTKAYEELMEAQNELYNFDKDQASDYYDKALEAYEEYLQKAADIREKYSEEEALPLLEQLKTSTVAEMSSYASLFNTSLSNTEGDREDILGDNSIEGLLNSIPYLSENAINLFANLADSEGTWSEELEEQLNSLTNQMYSDINSVSDAVSDLDEKSQENLSYQSQSADTALTEALADTETSSELLDKSYEKLTDIKSLLEKIESAVDGSAIDTELTSNMTSVSDVISSSVLDTKSSLDTTASLSDEYSYYSNLISGLSSDNNLDQKVYITANFTEATSADEILKALNSITNKATQIAYSS